MLLESNPLSNTHVCVRVNKCLPYLFVHHSCMYDIFRRYSEYICTMLFAYCDESRHMYEWVMAHIRHIHAIFGSHIYDTVCILREMSHGTYMNTSLHILYISQTWHHALFRVHIQDNFLYMTMSHGAHTYEWVMAYLWHIHALFWVHIQDICIWWWVMAHIHMNEWWHIHCIRTRDSEHTYEICICICTWRWVMAHVHTYIWMSDGTYMTYSRVVRSICITYDVHMTTSHGTHIYERVMAHQ